MTREQDSHVPAHIKVVNETTSPAATVEAYVPDFVRIELDLHRCAAGTILRYRGSHEVTVIVLDTGFEVASTGFTAQRWDFTDTIGRHHAITQAAQFVANRLSACLDTTLSAA